MPTVGEIFEFLNTKAPVSTKLDFDNVGLLVGDGRWTVDTVLLSLDIMADVVREAAALGAGPHRRRLYAHESGRGGRGCERRPGGCAGPP